MASRYDNREINTNSTEMYKNVLKDRGVRQVQQYATPNFMNLKKEQISSLTIIDHIWKRGDHFYKLAAQYYGNPTYWWVIAQFNNLPTEANIQFGDVVLIPNPLEEILGIYTSVESNNPPPAGGY
tara:strand:+ start:1199 stop:1573 length:375 start_codon:yes stop_codon:yes gene_type:complete